MEDEARARRGAGDGVAAWSVAPGPTEEDLAALAVAVAVVLDEAGDADAPPPDHWAPAWAMAGRRQALLGRDGGPVSGWGRPSPSRRGR